MYKSNNFTSPTCVFKLPTCVFKLKFCLSIFFFFCISQTIRNILESTFGGQALVEEMESGLISYKARKKIVATLVSHLIEHHGKQ